MPVLFSQGDAEIRRAANISGKGRFVYAAPMLATMNEVGSQLDFTQDLPELSAWTAASLAAVEISKPLKDAHRTAVAALQRQARKTLGSDTARFILSAFEVTTPNEDEDAEPTLTQHIVLERVSDAS